MTVLTISQETLIMLPAGATGGNVKITYNGTTVGSVIASGNDQGRAVAVSGRLVKLTALDGISPLQIVGRESGGRRPATVTLRIYPIYPPGVDGPPEPITLTGLPVGSPDVPGIWDLSNIDDSSGGLDVVTAAERQSLALLKESAGTAATSAIAAARSASGAKAAADASIANLNSTVQGAAQQAAGAAVAGVTDGTEQATQQAQQAAATALSAAAVDGRVGTVDLLPAAAEGSVYLVLADGLPRQKTGSTWVDRPDLALALGGTDRASIIYSAAQGDIARRVPHRLPNVRRAVAEGRPIRVLWTGDSITADGDTNPQGTDRYADRVMAAIRQAVGPDVQIISENMAIGSRRLAQMVNPNYLALDSMPANGEDGFYKPNWSNFTVDQSWRWHLENWQADVLIIAHGMNGTDALSLAAGFANDLNAFLSDIEAWGSSPNPVLVSGFEPTTDTGSITSKPTVVRAFARTVRAIAKLRGIPHADAHRLYRAVRDGVDDVYTQTYPILGLRGWEDGSEWGFDPSLWNMSRGSEAGPLKTSTVLQNGPDGVRYVESRRTFRDGFLDIGIVFTDASQVGEVYIRSDPTEPGSIAALITPNRSGHKGNISIFLTPQNVLLWGQEFDIPVGSMVGLRWLFQGENHALDIQIYGSSNESVQHFEFANAFGQMDGRVMFGCGAGSCPRYLNTQLYAYLPLGTDISAPLANQATLLGTRAATNWPASSGNGLNHPTSAGHALFYAPAFDGVIRAFCSASSRPRAVHTPALLNSYQAGGWSNVTVVRDGGTVTLRGRVTGGNGESRIMVLPTWAWPTVPLQIVATVSPDGSAMHPGLINVGSDGNVDYYSDVLQPGGWIDFTKSWLV